METDEPTDWWPVEIFVKEMPHREVRAVRLHRGSMLEAPEGEYLCQVLPLEVKVHLCLYLLTYADPSREVASIPRIRATLNEAFPGNVYTEESDRALHGVLTALFLKSELGSILVRVNAATKTVGYGLEKAAGRTIEEIFEDPARIYTLDARENSKRYAQYVLALRYILFTLFGPAK